MSKLEQAARQALEALEFCKKWASRIGFDAAITALREALAEQATVSDGLCGGCAKKAADGWALYCVECWEQTEQEPVACEPVSPIDDDGWSDWICPKPQGYLMQCCDCGLIHEVDSRVAKYEPRPSEEFVVVNDQNMQSQWRMRRRDDLASPQQSERMIFQAREIGESEWFDVGLNETERINAYINSPHIDYRRLYAAPVRTKDLTDDEIYEVLWRGEAFETVIDSVRAVIAADREKNK